MRTIIIAVIFAMVGIVCSAQSAPLGTPKTRITKSNESKRTEKSAERRANEIGPQDNSLVINQVDASPQQEHENQTSRKNKKDSLLAWFTGLLVLVGLLQVGALVWQVIVFNRTLRLSGDTAERQLRAYVGVSKVFLDMTNPALPIGAVEIQNFGQTPAYKVKQWIGITPHPYPLSIKLTNMSGSSSSMAVLSRDMKHSSIVPLKKPFPVTAIPAIGSPQLTIYVFGGVTYEDVFGHERHVAYRFIYGGPESPKNITDGGRTIGTMSPDTDGNESD